MRVARYVRMMTTKDLLVKYNDLASRLDLPVLKTWKKKRADLESAIDALEEKARESSGCCAQGLTVTDIARELGISPKVARGKLRRAGMNAKDGRWPTCEPGTDDHARIVEVLRGEQG